MQIYIGSGREYSVTTDIKEIKVRTYMYTSVCRVIPLEEGLTENLIISAILVDFIDHFEGFRTKVYMYVHKENLVPDALNLFTQEKCYGPWH